MHLLLSHLVGGWGRNQRRNRDCEGRRRLGISRQVDAVTIPQQLSAIASFQGAIRFQFHRLSVFEVIKQIVSCSHNKAKKHRSVGFQRLTPCREFPRIFSMSRIIYVCVEVLWSFRIWNCFLLLPTHVSPLPLFLKLENRCSVRIPYDTGAIDCFRPTINQVYSVRIPILIHVCIQSHLSVCVCVCR